MKKLIALALAGAAVGVAHAQANVSINVHQPGVWAGSHRPRGCLRPRWCWHSRS